MEPLPEISTSMNVKRAKRSTTCKNTDGDANRLVSEQKFYLSRLRHVTCGLDENFQFTCKLGSLHTNLTSMERIVDTFQRQQLSCYELVQCGDLNISVLSVRNKKPIEFEVSSNDGKKAVFTLNELNNLSSVLSIIITKLQMINTLNLPKQYFSLVSQYSGDADWINFSNFVKSLELEPVIVLIILEYNYLFRKTVNLRLLYKSGK